MNTTMKVLRWASVAALTLGLSALAMGCDNGPDFDSGLDNGKLGEGECTEYPGESQTWAMDTVVPPSHFDGDPVDLDLEGTWCNKGSIKSLIFILGYPT